MSLQELSNELKRVEEEFNNLPSKPVAYYNSKKEYIQPPEDKVQRWYKKYKLIGDKRQQLYDKIRKSDRKVQIKHPEKLIAGRVVLSYAKIEHLYVNDLLHIPLTDSKQEGNITLPYKLDFEGNAIKTNSSVNYEYRIKRIGKKVYWLVSIEDLLRY